MSTNNNENYYRTSDMPLAAYLVYKEFFLREITQDEFKPSRKVFVFERKKGTKIENIVEEFYAKKALVEPRKYFDDLKTIKNRIYDNH